MQIGEVIAYIRRQNKLSQEEFGSQFYKSQRYVSFVESGKETPDLQFLIEVANEYDSDVIKAYICGYTTKMLLERTVKRNKLLFAG